MNLDRKQGHPAIEDWFNPNQPDTSFSTSHQVLVTDLLWSLLASEVTFYRSDDLRSLIRGKRP
jgi:hypothetical protein